MTRSANAMPALHFDELAKLEAGYWWHVGRVEWVLSLIAAWSEAHPSPEGLAYADFGCGTGGVATAVEKAFRVRDTWLVDSHPAAFPHLSTGPHRVALCHDLAKPVPLGRPMDLVTCLDVLEHVDDDRAVLANIAASLRTGGLAVLTVPAHQMFFSDWDVVLGHHRRYEAQDLTAKVREAGLMVETARHVWSFLAPMALVRKRQRRAPDDAAEFPRVAPLLNATLIGLSRLERRWPTRLAPPFGTSIIVAAVKP